MTFLTELEVVNECLGLAGELPVNSLEDGHPMVPAALRALGIANKREQTKSWWFNRELVDLAPNVDGQIYLPNDVLKVDPESASSQYVQRGRRLYKPFEPTVANKYTFSQTVRVWLVREVPFEDCPFSAQQLISCSTQLDFMSDFDADEQKYAKVRDAYRDAVITIGSEHVRATGANMFQRRALRTSRTEVGTDRLIGQYLPHD